jgi:hypothetical protein
MIDDNKVEEIYLLMKNGDDEKASKLKATDEELDLVQKLLEEDSPQSVKSQDNEPSTLESVLAYPAAFTKGETLGLDKYVGGLAETAKDLVTGQGSNYMQNVENYAKMRDGLISHGGTSAATVELGASAFSPVKILSAANKLASVVNPAFQAAIYGSNESENPIEGGIQGAGVGAAFGLGGKAIGKAVPATLSGMGEGANWSVDKIKSLYKSGKNMFNEGARKAEKESIAGEYRARSEDMMNALKGQTDASGKNIGETYSKLDRQVGRGIPSEYVTGKDASKIGEKVVTDYSDIVPEIPVKEPLPDIGLGDKTSTISSMSKEAGKQKPFLSENIANKNKFIDMMDGLNERVTFGENASSYKNAMQRLAKQYEKAALEIQGTATHSSATGNALGNKMDALDTEFADKFNRINDRYIKNLKPSEVWQLKKEIQGAINYGTQIVKDPQGRVQQTIKPQNGPYEAFVGDLMGLEKRTDKILEQYAANELGVDLPLINKQYNVARKVEELMPTAEDMQSIVKAEEKNNINIMTEKMRDIDRMLGEAGLQNLRGQITGRTGDLVTRMENVGQASKGGLEGFVSKTASKAGSIANKPLVQALGKAASAIPRGVMLESQTRNRSPQSIEEVKLMTLPRDTNSVIEQPELFLQKVKLEDPQAYEILNHAIQVDPESVPDILFQMSQAAPTMFERDKYGRFDGKLPVQSMDRYLADVRMDNSLPNSEKAKILNLALSKKQGHYTPVA